MYYLLENQVPKKVSRDIYISKFDSQNVRVAKDTINGIDISTVFLGIDHGFAGNAPMLFETMVFGGPDNQYQERYSTWEQAEKGHQRAVNMVKGGNILQENNLL